MTEMELKLQKLEWRIVLIESVVVKMFAATLSVVVGISHTKLSELLARLVDGELQSGESALLADQMLEDRERLAAAYRQVCEEIKEDFVAVLADNPPEELQKKE